MWHNWICDSYSYVNTVKLCQYTFFQDLKEICDFGELKNFWILKDDIIGMKNSVGKYLVLMEESVSKLKN